MTERTIYRQTDSVIVEGINFIDLIWRIWTNFKNQTFMYTANKAKWQAHKLKWMEDVRRMKNTFHFEHVVPPDQTSYK